MPVMLTKTYDALRAAGAPEDHAKAAAEEIAGFERRLFRLEIMVGLTLAGVVSLIVRSFAG